jgi:hypothetical protein
MVASADFSNDDVHPPSMVYGLPKKQKVQRVRFTASRTSLRLLVAAWGHSGDVGKSANGGPCPRYRCAIASVFT